MTRVLVTGAASGLGRAFVHALAGSGASVLAADVNETGLSETAAGAPGDVHTSVCDVTDPDAADAAVSAAVSAFGGLDGLVNSAGIVAVTRGPSREIPLDEYERVMAVNVRGTWLMCRAAIPALSESGAASIVNLSSESAFSGSHGMSHYVASKAAILGMTRALARELGPAGIRVNAIAPGYTDTEGGRAIGDPSTYDVSATPLGRVARPDDMAGTLLYLLGPASAFVTGQVLLVNGGRITA